MKLHGTYEKVFLSPHLDDVVFSCPLALQREREAWSRVLVVTLFCNTAPDSPSEEYLIRRQEEQEACRRAGFDSLAGPFLDAPWRNPRYRSFNGILWAEEPSTEDVLPVAEWIAHLLEKVTPRELYVPLGVGRHIDHRLAFSASLKANKQAGAGAKVWAYEDRPYALVRWATEMRLRELGVNAKVDENCFYEELATASYVKKNATRPGELAQCIDNYRAQLESSRTMTPLWQHRVLVSNDLRPIWHLVSSYESQLDSFVGDENSFARSCGEMATHLGEGCGSFCAEGLWRRGLRERKSCWKPDGVLVSQPGAKGATPVEEIAYAERQWELL